MKLEYEREQGMTSIYRKLRKECRSFNVRRHLTTLILAVAMMTPAGVYADWTGSIVSGSEKPAGQAYDDGFGWADNDDNFAGQIQFEGHGVVHLVKTGGIENEKTVHGSARLTVDTTVATSLEGDVFLQDCDHTFLCLQSPNEIRYTKLEAGEMVTVELKGAFEVTFNGTVIGSHRGTLTLKLTPVLP